VSVPNDSRATGVPLILNVDDTASARYMKTRMLRQAGYSVIEAATGAEALQLLRQHTPQLVLLDVNLPDVSGIEVSRRIKGDPQTRSVPIVQISATHVTEHDQQVGLEGGAEIYLTEPLQPHELSTVVRVLLRLHSTERGLLQSEARWRSFIESNIVGVMVLENDRIIEANVALQQMLGYDAAELAALDWRTLTPPDDLPRSERAFAELKATGMCAPFEKQYLRKDGSRIWVTLGAAMLGDSGDRWMCFVLDISDRKHAAMEREAAFERERSARTHAEDATRLKDEFLANLSHELRTPMNAIMGWTHLLKAGRLDDNQRARALESIDRAARSQAQLIEDLLDVSRIVSGKLYVAMQPIDLSSVIEAALESQRPAAYAKGVQLHAHRPANPIIVRGDAGRLQQVVLNLLSNAVKFTPTGGRIDVSLERASDDEARISVRDTGEGINPEFLPYVFDRFRQADGTSTRTHMGLGIGLAIVRHVVELHGGSVHAASEGHDKGATFTVTLPIAAVALRRPEAAIPEMSEFDATSGAGIQVLIVEDDRETRDLLSTILERTGHSHRVAASAKDALALLDDWLPDVLVSDIGMPGMDGYEFIRTLRARPFDKGGRLPALALSAYVRSEDKQLALASGYQAHISKPVDPSALLTAIARLTESHRATDG
jgi:PAS domain S-box-containing protein